MLRSVFQYVAVGVIFVLGGCAGWDADDGSVVPKKRGALLLAESATGRSAIYWPEDEAPYSIAPSALLPEPADFALQGGAIWLAFPNERQLVRLDRNLAETKRLELDFSPSAVASGSEWFFAADSAENKLYFLDPNDGYATAHSADLQARPERLYYNSGKLYALCAGGRIEIWREETLSRITTLATGGEIIDADFDRLYNLRLMVRRNDGQNLIGFIDANGDALRDFPAETSLLKIRYSPHFRQYYEREWEEDVLLGPDSTLNANVPFAGISDFEIDFDYSELYLLENDSLRKFNLKTGALSPGPFFKGRLLKGAYLYE